MKQLNWYQIFGKSNIPDGRTVLPTDDIQIWLNCANIWDKDYTTLAEVLADTTTLLALINSPNAVDYMVRSTTWAVSISVPKMVSNTSPSGVCSASSVYSGYPAWYAFDDNFSYYWNSANAGTSDYIQYEFPQKVRVDRFKIIIENNSAAGFHNITLSCGDTESDLVNHGNFTLEASTDLQTFEINADLNAKIFRLTSQAESGRYGCVRLLNFYSIGITDNATAMSYIGLNNYCANTLLADSTWCEAICNSEYFESVLNVKVPAMTSNTTPEGTVFGRQFDNMYKACNGDSSAGAQCKANTFGQTGANLGYKFTSLVRIYKTYIKSNIGYSMTERIQASNDGETFEDLASFTLDNDKTTVLDGSVSYDSYRYYFDGAIVQGGAQYYPQIYTMQFYGRVDV